MNSGCLFAFCCCNGCCFALSLCNFLQLLGLAIGGAAAGGGTVTCSDLEEFGYSVETCRATVNPLRCVHLEDTFLNKI